MKKMIALAATTAILLAGCSKDVQNPDDGFFEAAQTNLGPLERTSTIRLGHVICEGLDSGITVWDIAEQADRAGVDSKKAGTVVGLSIKYLCPRHLDKVPAVG